MRSVLSTLSALLFFSGTVCTALCVAVAPASASAGRATASLSAPAHFAPTAPRDARATHAGHHHSAPERSPCHSQPCPSCAAAAQCCERGVEALAACAFYASDAAPKPLVFALQCAVPGLFAAAPTAARSTGWRPVDPALPAKDLTIVHAVFRL